MGTKTLTITEEAYDRLKAHKQEGESFTDVVLRLTGGEADVAAGAGAWEGTGFAAAVEAGREEFDDDVDEYHDALLGN